MLYGLLLNRVSYRHNLYPETLLFQGYRKPSIHLLLVSTPVHRSQFTDKLYAYFISSHFEPHLSCRLPHSQEALPFRGYHNIHLL